MMQQNILEHDQRKSYGQHISRVDFIMAIMFSNVFEEHNIRKMQLK